MGLKILHTADWHMDAAFSSFSEEQRAFLRREQLKIPGKIAEICRREQCDLVLLAGDVFDGIPSREAIDTVKRTLKDCNVPVFVTPGNHDFCQTGSPWVEEQWSENVTEAMENAIWVTIHKTGENSRRIVIEGGEDIADLSL